MSRDFALMAVFAEWQFKERQIFVCYHKRKFMTSIKVKEHGF